jgi:adenosylmethionine-8-amino-7-oxononanoate aminotransferase
VQDRVSKQPFAKKQNVVHRVIDRAFEMGLIAYYSVGCVDGVNGDVVMLGPPLIVDEAQVDEMVGLLAEAIRRELGH